MHMCVCTHKYRCPQRLEEGTVLSGGGGVASYLAVGVRNQLKSSAKASSTVHHRAVPSAPHYIFTYLFIGNVSIIYSRLANLICNVRIMFNFRSSCLYL